MKALNIKKRLKFYGWIALLFLSFWVIHDLVNYLETFTERVANNIWRLAFVTIINFLLFEYTIPFVRKKRTSFYLNVLITIPCLFIYLMVYSWGMYGWRLLGIALHIYSALVTFTSAEHAVSNQMSYSVMSVFFFGVSSHIYNYIKLRQAAQQLLIEKQAAELNYLKSQTNPHFLFNTLNNIYSLARDKNDLAPESILRLSKILRYMLYEAGGAYIAIEQELKIIGDYIDLEKLRYDETLRINFNYDVEDMKQALPPLLLMPLVENAFKHGVSETRGQPFVDVHLTIKQRQLVFIVKNSFESSEDVTVKENIGLSNLRRQLQLLYSDYNLSLQQGNAAFTATLKINLASHV